jgi:GST-like protein
MRQHREKGPISVFESGAILLYLADKVGRFISPGPTDRVEVLQWFLFEASSLGATAAQVRFQANITRYGAGDMW